MEKVCWGEKGQFGPFSAQTDGWPNAGEVVRHYRLLVPLSAEQFGILYGNAIQGRPVSNKRIFQMENANQVPEDINRRRIITQLLGIPPILLGLAAIEDVQIPQEQKGSEKKGPTLLIKKSETDLSLYKQNMRMFWTLHFTSSAQSVFPQVLAGIQKLEKLKETVAGSLQWDTLELLYSHYKLAALITSDWGRLSEAYGYANHTVRIAKMMNEEATRSDARERSAYLAAAAYYLRGFVRLEWGGRFIGIANVLQPDHVKIQSAIQDFQQALPQAHPQLKGLILKELGSAQGVIQRSGTDIVVAEGTLDAARNALKPSTLQDPIEQILLGGAPGVSQGWYYIGKAITLTNVGRSGKAIEVLEELDTLKAGIPKDQTRNNAWIDIIYAQAALGNKEVDLAAAKATKALSSCKDISSTTNMNNIRDIYQQLLATPYKSDRGVKALGQRLNHR